MKPKYIYFLLQEKRIVYIGQTIDFNQRKPGHADKDYDSFRLIKCPADKADHYEQRLIKYFKPLYNQTFNPAKIKRQGIIHEGMFTSEVSKRYFALKGEKLTTKEAHNRWKMVRKPDKLLLSKVFAQIYIEQQNLLQ